MNATVLMVEDDAGLRQMLSWELEDLGYAVTAVKSCAEALDMLTVHRFDAALLDYCLPDGNGLDLLIALREKVPSLPVIMSSALACAETRERALALGASCFLTKPASVEVLDRWFRRLRA
jgi:DNA-binding response OmpR family regulator